MTTTTRREAEIVEDIVRSMSEREYGQLIAWLASGITGSLWDCLHFRASKPERDRSQRTEP
jgi:hypothetical protein